MGTCFRTAAAVSHSPHCGFQAAFVVESTVCGGAATLLPHCGWQAAPASGSAAQRRGGGARPLRPLGRSSLLGNLLHAVAAAAAIMLRCGCLATSVAKKRILQQRLSHFSHCGCQACCQGAGFVATQWLRVLCTWQTSGCAWIYETRFTAAQRLRHFFQLLL